jgi:hypothetical protein
MDEPVLLQLLGETEEELRRHAELIGMTPDVEASLRAAREAAEGRGDRPLTVALVGENRAWRHAIVDALLGASVLASSAKGQDLRVTFVRAAPIGYTAHSRDGRHVVEFARRMPGRGDLFERSLAQAEKDRTAAVAQHEEQRERSHAALERATQAAASVEGTTQEMARAEADAGRRAAEHRASPQAPTFLLAKPPWWAVWLWFLRLLVRPWWRDRLQLRASRESDLVDARSRVTGCTAAVAAAVQERNAAEGHHRAELALAEDTSAVDAAHARVERLRAERDKYSAERESGFLEDLRAMGDEIAELTIEYPAKHLPVGVTLLDVPSPATEEGRRIASSAILREADAFLSAVEDGRPSSAAGTGFVDELASSMPRLLVVSAKANGSIATGLAAALERWLAARPLIFAARAAMRLEHCIGPLTRVRDDAEARHRKRLAALEGQRIPDPAQFRAGQMGRAHAAIEKAADDALRSAIEMLRASLAELRTEWTERITSCTDRSSVEACIRAIDEGATGRVDDILERTTDYVAGDLQNATDTIESWALEEMQARYQLVRKLGAEVLAPLASELTRGDLALGPRSAPAEGALDAFERQRVGYGLGGVAAGAALGTLVLPGVGTAIGAFLGVFAGFLKGVDSLKQDCLAKIGACLVDAESHAIAQLESKRPDLSRTLHTTIDEGLGEALGRLEQSITRLMELERRAIATERAKLEDLDAARLALARSDVRLGRITEAAMSRLATAAHHPTETRDRNTDAADVTTRARMGR